MVPNASNYQNRRGYSATIERIEDLTRRERQHTPSDRCEQADRLHYPDALSHYLATYSSPATPPSWLVIELLTAGELQHLYASLPLKYRKIIARELNLPDQVLQSWLKTYVRVRNICAHHGRLWNRFLGVYPAIPRSPTIRWLNDRSTFDTGNPRALERKRLYPVLVSLQSILFTISPHSTWALRLHTLLEKYHDIPLNALGMKANWDADEFWQETFEAGS
ncbi:Abi family protein [Actinomyces stomatis]|uniref:Abi family protein n=1 Tax=Actinomyces stomatis TaxID=3050227 RepID=UPI002852CBB9|nr:Abi family protein [Actinomyces sp. PK606]